jgi:hypothetical protein
VAEIKQGDPLPPNVGNPRGGPSPWPWAIPQMKRMRPTKAALRDHYDPLFPDFKPIIPTNCAPTNSCASSTSL